MRRAFVGLALVAHGLAHALPAAQAGAAAESWLLTAVGAGPGVLRWVVALLSAVAMAGFVASGLGVWGIRSLGRRRFRLAEVAAWSSVILLLLFWPNVLGAVGLAVDAAILWAIRSRPHLLTGVRVDTGRGDRGRARTLATALAKAGGVAFVVWIALVSATAPWHRFWGSTAQELAVALPGDTPLDGRPPTYWIQHAVSIRAPADVVWPWLAQLGTDKGGFYSYSFLERLFGFGVRNADRIHEEWQDVETGGFVVGAPAGYLWFDEPLGWNLTLVEPGRVMVLEYWGAFVLVPQDDGTTRFIVRTRNVDPPTFAGLAFAWLGLVTFEPAHFLMERQMLLGIKRRAEGTIREVGR